MISGSTGDCMDYVTGSLYRGLYSRQFLVMQGGPYNQVLHDVLGAYACYRPDVGYVQGMSFLAGVLLLNMEASDAFICLANLLNRSSYTAFFRVDHNLMSPYFAAFTVLLQDYLPRIHAHFTQMEFSPEYYLIEWSATHEIVASTT